MVNHVTLTPDFAEAFEYGLSRRMNPVALAAMTSAGFLSHGFRAYQRLGLLLDAIEDQPTIQRIEVLRNSGLVPGDTAEVDAFIAFDLIARHDRQRLGDALPHHSTFQPVRGPESDAINRHRAILVTYAARVGIHPASFYAENILRADFAVGVFALQFFAMIGLYVDTTERSIATLLAEGDRKEPRA